MGRNKKAQKVKPIVTLGAGTLDEGNTIWPFVKMDLEVALE